MDMKFFNRYAHQMVHHAHEVWPMLAVEATRVSLVLLLLMVAAICIAFAVQVIFYEGATA